jgi:Arc/MetJ-type ribon-helix-helix transcriptional regulator
MVYWYISLMLGADPQSPMRLVRVPLPADLVRRIDSLVRAPASAFVDRTEFIREAVEAYVLEQEFGGPELTLKHEQPPPDAELRSSAAAAPIAAVEQGTSGGSEPTGESVDVRMGSTELRAPALPPSLLDGGFEAVDEPIMGLHNRDYPSLWALARLAEWCADGPLEFDDYLARVTAQAWSYVELLEILGKREGTKFTALFPSNPNKVESAESIWRNFALGRLHREGDLLRGDGPLFQWKVCGLAILKDSVVVAPSPLGLGLLQSIEGLRVASPHSPEQADAFLNHLREHAPADWWGFGFALRLASAEPTRREYEGAFVAELPDWSETKCKTVAAGYLARCREWGLIEKNMIEGRYRLTDRAADWNRGQ